jgi:hypothetical protein
MVFPINCDFSRLRPMPDPRVVDAVILAVFDVATVTFSLSGVKDRLQVGSGKLQRTSIGSSLPVSLPSGRECRNLRRLLRWKVSETYILAVEVEDTSSLVKHQCLPNLL